MADFPDKTDYSRLRAWLSDSKINQTNNPLWQTVSSLIKGAQNWGDFSKQTFSQVSGTSSAATGQNNITQTINNIINQFNNISGNYVTGPASAVDGQAAVFDGITGKIIKAFGLSGVVTAISGVLGSTPLTASVNDYLNGAGAFAALPVYPSLRVTLTNAQIKALPTTPITLVPAQGIGTRIIPLFVDLQGNLTASYTNVNADANMYASLPSAQGQTNYILNDSTIPITLFSDFMTIGRRRVLLQPYTNTEPVNGWGNIADVQDLSALSYNTDFKLFAANNGAGDYTAGDPANLIEITSYYSVVSY